MIPEYEELTYYDYINLPEGARVELIEGVLYDMSLSPSPGHQDIIGFLHLEIGNHLKHKSCKVFVSPFDVFLIHDYEKIEDCKTVVQPDIFVLCDKNKLFDKGCKGAPDFVIEVVSPYHRSHDYIKKLKLYNLYGVKEYWIVNTKTQIINVYIAGDGNGFNESFKYTFKEKIKSFVLTELEIDLSEYFDLSNW